MQMLCIRSSGLKGTISTVLCCVHTWNVLEVNFDVNVILLGQVSTNSGMNYWNGTLDWTTGLDYWTESFSF